MAQINKLKKGAKRMDGKLKEILEKLNGRRIVVLGDDINKKQVGELGGTLLQLSLESNDGIRLLIDSGGGSVRAGLSLCDIIASIGASVTGVVVGECASMAMNVLQACKKRLALKHAVFFLHFTSTHFDFSHRLAEEEIQALFKRRLEEGRSWQAKTELLIAKRAGKSMEDVRRLMQEGDTFDKHLTAEEALSERLIDAIVDDPKGILDEEWNCP